MKIDFKEIKDMLQTESLSEVSRQTGIPLRTLENYKHGYNKSFEKMEDTLTKLQNFINKERNKMECIKELAWEEFMALDEVQVEGSELFYNDGTVQVSVEFEQMMIDENDEVIQEGHDDITLWEDEELAEELRELVIEEYENLA